MKKTVLMSAAKKARIALAVLAVCGMSFVGAQSAFAENVTIDAKKNIICGDGAVSMGHDSVVIGSEAKTDNINSAGVYMPTYNSVAIGAKAKAVANDSTAIGYGAVADYSFSTAIGSMAEAAAFGISLGANAKSTVFSDAIGVGAEAKKEYSVAIGFGSIADEENTVSVGSGGVTGYFGPAPKTRRIVNVTDGTKNTDAATFGQIIKAGEYNLTLAADGSGQVTLQTNAGANGPTIKVDASALAGGGSTLTQEQFNTMLDANTKFTGLQTEVGNKANANGDNITTGAGSKWAETLGTGAIANGDKNLVNGETVYNKIGDTSKLTTANLGNNLSDAVVKVNTKAETALNKAKDNEKKIGDTTQLTTAGLGDNLSDAVVKVNDKVGDTGKLTTAGLGNNLSDAVVKVDEKTKQNAKDIEKVNGRVDELGGRVDTLGGAVSKLDTKVNKVGAGAAALAALHPMEFDSDNKLTFAAGVGSYHGASAAAIGAFYRPSEQVMFSIAGNMGNGENMVNAGVSFALDRPSKTPTTKAALVKTVVAQNEQIAALNETLAVQNEKIARLEAMVEKLAAKGK
ncbi:YadA-like family protein [uncultured Phascolarctobacterium sp.]|uniref:YadA-like family protein n=1 Tax=uncultured Phascolarctobacterium sp. TaxID=512296 RepID=UPI002604CC18|nr:YadA-like family protein [uncultured Phascolarctobacterium sp.]